MFGHSDPGFGLIKTPNAQVNFVTWHIGFVSILDEKTKQTKKTITTANIKPAGGTELTNGTTAAGALTRICKNLGQAAHNQVELYCGWRM
jgi:hypothetical protein